jgi:hypothetical protein
MKNLLRKSLFLKCKILFFFGSFAWIQTVSASFDLDKKFFLEKIAILKASDPWKGLFAEMIHSVYVDYFSTKKRFLVADFSEVQPILAQFESSERSLLENVQILAEIARVTQSSSLLRTQVFKESNQYHFKIDWLHAPWMERIAKIEFFLDPPEPGTPFKMETIKSAFDQQLDSLLAQVPFLGEITGRDANLVTLNLGAASGILPGSVLEMSTLEEVKKHPLLNEIASWKLVPTGKVEIEHVKESLSFGKVIHELDHQKIARYQKITQIELSPPEKPSRKDPAVPSEVFESHYGWIAGGMVFGSASYHYSTPGLAYESANFLPSVTLQSELWFSESWFSLLHFYYAPFHFIQKNSNSGSLSPMSQVGGSFGSWSSFKLGMGYLQPVFENDAQIRFKWGYQRFLYQIPFQGAPEYTAASNAAFLWVGVQGDSSLSSFLNFFLGFHLGLIPLKASHAWVGSFKESSWSEWEGGADWVLRKNLKLRLSLDFQSFSMSSPSRAFVQQKILSVGPMLLYFF